MDRFLLILLRMYSYRFRICILQPAIEKCNLRYSFLDLGGSFVSRGKFSRETEMFIDSKREKLVQTIEIFISYTFFFFTNKIM